MSRPYRAAYTRPKTAAIDRHDAQSGREPDREDAAGHRDGDGERTGRKRHTALPVVDVRSEHEHRQQPVAHAHGRQREPTAETGDRVQRDAAGQNSHPPPIPPIPQAQTRRPHRRRRSHRARPGRPGRNGPVPSAAAMRSARGRRRPDRSRRRAGPLRAEAARARTAAGRPKPGSPRAARRGRRSSRTKAGKAQLLRKQRLGDKDRHELEQRAAHRKASQPMQTTCTRTSVSGEARSAAG